MSSFPWPIIKVQAHQILLHVFYPPFISRSERLPFYGKNSKLPVLTAWRMRSFLLHPRPHRWVGNMGRRWGRRKKVWKLLFIGPNTWVRSPVPPAPSPPLLIWSNCIRLWLTEIKRKLSAKVKDLLRWEHSSSFLSSERSLLYEEKIDSDIKFLSRVVFPRAFVKSRSVACGIDSCIDLWNV